MVISYFIFARTVVMKLYYFPFSWHWYIGALRAPGQTGERNQTNKYDSTLETIIFNFLFFALQFFAVISIFYFARTVVMKLFYFPFSWHWYIDALRAPGQTG
jgi:hypothetical protein